MVNACFHAGKRPIKLWSFVQTIWVLNPKIGVKPPKWMVKIMEHPIKMDDLGVPLFLETSIYHIWYICSCLCLQLHQRRGTPGSVPGKRTPFLFLRRLQWRSWTLCFYTVSWPSLFHTYIAVNTRPLSTFTTQIVVDLGNPVFLVRWLSTYHIFHPSEIDLSRVKRCICDMYGLNCIEHLIPRDPIPIGAWMVRFG